MMHKFVALTRNNGVPVYLELFFHLYMAELSTLWELVPKAVRMSLLVCSFS